MRAILVFLLSFVAFSTSAFAAETEELSAKESFILGSHYYYEKNDLKEAERWYKQSAEHNYAPAANQLGMIALRNNQDTKAFMWFEKAAKAGERAAQYNLAGMFHYGLGGVEKNVIEAYAWYTAAEQNGYRSLEAEKADLAIPMGDDLAAAKLKAARYASLYATALEYAVNHSR